MCSKAKTESRKVYNKAEEGKKKSKENQNIKKTPKEIQNTCITINDSIIEKIYYMCHKDFDGKVTCTSCVAVKLTTCNF